MLIAFERGPDAHSDRHRIGRPDRLGVRARTSSQAGYDVVGIENDMRAQLLRAGGLDGAHDASARARATRDAFRSLELDIRDADAVSTRCSPSTPARSSW